PSLRERACGPYHAEGVRGLRRDARRDRHCRLGRRDTAACAHGRAHGARTARLFLASIRVCNSHLHLSERCNSPGPPGPFTTASKEFFTWIRSPRNISALVLPASAWAAPASAWAPSSATTSPPRCATRRPRKRSSAT